MTSPYVDPDAVSAYEEVVAVEAVVTSALPEPGEAPVPVTDPEMTGLLRQVATRMGGVSESDALRRSLRTMLALYDAKAQGGKPVVRYDRTEQSVNLPGAS